MTKIKIEKGVPLPETPWRTGFAETFRKMKIGDSALFPERQSFVALAKQCGGKVTTRKEGTGVRVWRTA